MTTFDSLRLLKIPPKVLLLLSVVVLVGLLPAKVMAETPDSMVTIPSGTYTIGSPRGTEHVRPQHTVILDTFLIDRYEVTNADYVGFLNSFKFESLRDFPPGRLKPSGLSDRARWLLLQHPPNGHPEPLVGLGDGDARIGINDDQFVIESGYSGHPVNEVTWYGAVEFCRWRDAKLPSEVQWEAAARGFEARRYPWGDTTPTRKHAVFGRSSNQTAAVGTHPAGATPRGVHDLSGNVAEWTISLFRPYPYDGSDGREAMTVNGERVTRGGDHVFDVSPSNLTTYFRDGFSRKARDGHRHIGFRCVRSKE